MSAKVYPVVMVAAMALATQLALVTPSVLQSLATPETQVIPEAPALQESHVAQPVTFCRSWGRSTHQGVEETLHPEPEFRVTDPFNCVLFQEAQSQGLGCGLGVVWGIAVGGALKCRWRVLWEAGGYGSGLVLLPGDGDEEKQPEGIQRVGVVLSRVSGEGLVGEGGSP